MGTVRGPFVQVRTTRRSSPLRGAALPSAAEHRAAAPVRYRSRRVGVGRRRPAGGRATRPDAVVDTVDSADSPTSPREGQGPGQASASAPGAPEAVPAPRAAAAAGPPRHQIRDGCSSQPRRAFVQHTLGTTCTRTQRRCGDTRCPRTLGRGFPFEQRGQGAVAVGQFLEAQREGQGNVFPERRRDELNGRRATSFVEPRWQDQARHA